MVFTIIIERHRVARDDTAAARSFHRSSEDHKSSPFKCLSETLASLLPPSNLRSYLSTTAGICQRDDLLKEALIFRSFHVRYSSFFMFSILQAPLIAQILRHPAFQTGGIFSAMGDKLLRFCKKQFFSIAFSRVFCIIEAERNSPCPNLQRRSNHHDACTNL